MSIATGETNFNRQARQLITELLAEGPVPYTTIKERVREAGIPLSVLLTMKRVLKIQSHKLDGRMVWWLPKAA